MIEENNASSGAVESSAQQSQAEAKPAQSELTAQDILAASTVQTELSAGNQDTGKSRWYIVHTYSGFEQRVEATIKEMMRNAQDNGLIHEARCCALVNASGMSPHSSGKSSEVSPRVNGKGCLTGRFRAVNFDDTSAGISSHAKSHIEAIKLTYREYLQLRLGTLQ